MWLSKNQLKGMLHLLLALLLFTTNQDKLLLVRLKANSKDLPRDSKDKHMLR